MDFLSKNASSTFGMVLGFFLLAEGLIQLFTGKVFGYANMIKKYTQESVERFVRPASAMYVLEGLGIIALALSVGGGPLPPFMMYRLSESLSLISCGF